MADSLEDVDTKKEHTSDQVDGLDVKRLADVKLISRKMPGGMDDGTSDEPDPPASSPDEAATSGVNSTNKKERGMDDGTSDEPDPPASSPDEAATSGVNSTNKKERARSYTDGQRDRIPYVSCMASSDVLPDDDIQQQIQEVREDLLELMERPDYRKHNILLLGKSGAGKSALINTVIEAVCGRYYDKAKPGKGVAQSKTLQLTYYENCGVVPADIPRKSIHKDIIRQLIPNLPNFFDAAARGNSDTPEMREILTLLLGGRVEPGTNIGDLEKEQERHGVGHLLRTRDTVYKQWKITKIVMVQSGRDTVADDLIKSINSVIGGQQDDDIFAVVSMHDLVVDRPPPGGALSEGASWASSLLPRQTRSRTAQPQPPLFRDDYENTVNDLAKQLSIENNLEYNLERWASYTDNTYCSADIDLQALRFLRKLVMPGRPAPPPSPGIPLWKQLRNMLYRLVTRLVIAAVAVVIIGILYLLLTSKT